MNIFDRLESEVRGYCRSWPTVFASAHGHTMVAEDGTEYLDFFAGAGALNYGHNHPKLIEALQAHLAEQGFIHALDISTTTKRDFMERFEEVVLKPARPGLQAPVPRSHRHQRGRGRPQAGPQGHRARPRRGLHQRLPRHDPGFAVGHR